MNTPEHRDPDVPAVEKENDLARELRLLRYAEPAPELRRHAMAGAAAALVAPPRKSLASWWPELALAAAATLLLSFSFSGFVAGPDASKAPDRAPIGIASQLGLGRDLGGYLEKRWAVAKGPAAPSRLAGLS